MAKKRIPDDPCTSYAKAVVAGKVVAGRLVKLACARHLRDMGALGGRSAGTRGLRFDAAAAQHAIDFIEGFLRLAGGKDEGTPFALQPWQAFVVGCLFGWLIADGSRRFRTAYVEAGKGSGKSPLAAAVGLYMLVGDGFPRAEVYAAATKRDQAMILFRDAMAMVDQSPELNAMLTRSGARGREWNLAHLDSGSFFRPISSDENSQSGPRVHCGLIDEIHEHRTAHVVDMMRAGTKKDPDALIFEITNSGFDRASVCWHHHEFSRQVLEGTVTNDSWFAYVCTLDSCEKHHAEGKNQPVDGCPDCDDWRDESVWLKANPNLGVSITHKYLREQRDEAVGMPTKEGTTKRLNFCVWTEGETQWLSADLWARGAGEIDPAALAGRECYAALDVASKIDVAAFVLAFPDFPEAGHASLLCHFWIPEATAQARSVADNIPWLVWEREGYVTLTDGEVIDQDAIEAAVVKARDDYFIKVLKVDPWNAAQITTHLMREGLNVEEFAQHAQNYNEPTKLFESMLKEGTLHHGSHPVLDWMAGNVSVLSNVNENIRPVKPKHGSPKKVDGIVAAVMALSGLIADAGPSVYEGRGVLTLGADGQAEAAPVAAAQEYEDDEDDRW